MYHKISAYHQYHVSLMNIYSSSFLNWGLNIVGSDYSYDRMTYRIFLINCWRNYQIIHIMVVYSRLNMHPQVVIGIRWCIVLVATDMEVDSWILTNDTEYTCILSILWWKKTKAMNTVQSQSATSWQPDLVLLISVVQVWKYENVQGLWQNHCCF